MLVQQSLAADFEIVLRVEGSLCLLLTAELDIAELAVR
jgi:hypothetical protein